MMLTLLYLFSITFSFSWMHSYDPLANIKMSLLILTLATSWSLPIVCFFLLDTTFWDNQKKEISLFLFFCKLNLPGNAQTVLYSSCGSDPAPQRRACACLYNCLGCYASFQVFFPAMQIHILCLARYCVLLFLAKFFVPLLSCPEAERTEGPLEVNLAIPFLHAIQKVLRIGQGVIEVAL